MSSRTAGFVNQLKKHQRTLFILAGVIVVLGAIYMLAAMKMNTTAEGFSTIEELPRLNNKEFKVADDETVIVFFKMGPCGHCKTFAPTWVKLFDKLNGTKLPTGKKCRMIIVDAEDKFARKSDIAGYPTIRKYFTTTQFEEHDGPRDEETVTEFIMSPAQKK